MSDERSICYKVYGLQACFEIILKYCFQKKKKKKKGETATKNS